MYSLCARSFAMPAVEVGAPQASPNPSMRPGFTPTKICRNAPREKRLGLKLKRYGSHVLRHACATHLLAQGLTLKEVGDPLGHVSVAATRIYAKVDLTALREVAALDVRPLVACIEQCEQVAAPFYRMGEIQALRAVGNLGLGGVA